MFKVISVVKAKDGVSRQEFISHWLEKHVEFAKQYKNIKKYVVNTVNEDRHKELGAPIQFDGVAELVWESKQAMQEDTSSAAGKAAGEDAATFMDYIDVLCDEHIIIDR